MEEFLESAPGLYFSSYDDGTLLQVNQTLCNRLGYTKEELIGQKVEKIFTVATRIFQQTHFFPLLKMQGSAEEIFITLETKEREQLPVLINAERKVIKERGVSQYIGIVVHNRKKFEDELVAARKEAEKALAENTVLLQTKRELQEHAELLDRQMYVVGKQNEELRQFNRVVTHDLQEPLRKLYVFASLVIDNPDDDRNKKTVKRIKSVAEQMRSILSGLQQYVWLTEAVIKASAISLEKVLLLIRSELEKENAGLNIQLEIEELPPIEADREQLQFLLREIISNSIRFRKLSNEVSIYISANTLKLNQFRTISGRYKYTEYIRLQIKDNGLGFDMAYKDQIFELFKRLHDVSGRGVGLALCKKIVENHQGTITVESLPGEGTVFSILLPVEQNEISSQESHAGKSQQNSYQP